MARKRKRKDRQEGRETLEHVRQHNIENGEDRPVAAARKYIETNEIKPSEPVIVKHNDHTPDRCLWAEKDLSARKESTKTHINSTRQLSSIDYWIDVLASDNADSRIQALEELICLGDEKATPAICGVLESDPNPDVRCAAAKALGQIFD